MSTNNKYMIAPILTLILSGLTRAQDEEGIKIDISSSMRGKWQNLRSPVEKAIRKDSHAKHSDSLSRQFRFNKTYCLAASKNSIVHP